MGLICQRQHGEPRRLSAAARPGVLDHLLRLDADDRYGRFSTVLSDAGIDAYVQRINFRRDLCFATHGAGGQISGFIHLAVCGTTAELGASVLPCWRRQGLARGLFASALGQAAALNISEIHLATGHPAARHICQQLGYASVSASGYPRVRVFLGRSESFESGQLVAMESCLRELFRC